MKILIIGLGNFGAPLAIKLTNLGHEVIGVDNRMEKVNTWKDHISHTICLDSTNTEAAQNLPLKESDIVIVAIGEDEGASIMTTAVMKLHNAKRIISRAVSPVQQTVLEAMGVNEIVHPEEDAADRLAKKLDLTGVLESFEIADNYNIVEAKVPSRFVGKTLKEIGFTNKYNVIVLTTMKKKEEPNLLGQKKPVSEIKGIARAETKLEEDDILVVFGKINNIEKVFSED